MENNFFDQTPYFIQQIQAYYQPKLVVETVDDAGTVDLISDHLYTGSAIETLTLTMTGVQYCNMVIETAASGTVDITFPVGTKFSGGTAPTISTGETWGFQFFGLNCISHKFE
jgi:hypothetical protein